MNYENVQFLCSNFRGLNIDSFNLAISYFNKVKTEYLISDKNKNIESCNFILHSLGDKKTYSNYNKAVEYFNKDSFETAISYFEKVKIDSLKKEIKNNIELCNLFLSNYFFHEEKQAYFIDKRDNHKYKVVKIGKNIWMAENIAFKTNTGYWESDKKTNVYKYGYFYNEEISKSVCPDGWHLPKKSEWEELIDYIGGFSNNLRSEEWDNGKNSLGFSALPTGYHISSNIHQPNMSYWRTDESYITFDGFKINTTNVASNSYYFPVRCVKN